MKGAFRDLVPPASISRLLSFGIRIRTVDVKETLVVLVNNRQESVKIRKTSVCSDILLYFIEKNYRC